MTSEKVELKTERLLLRPFRIGDVGDVFEYAKDPEWARYFINAVPQPYTMRDAEEFVARSLLTSWDTLPVFAIVYESAVVGGVHLDINQEDCVAALGYGLGRAYWGKGIVPEAVKAVIVWGFQKHDLAKIYATADPRNAQSLRVMEKVGLVREGFLRSHIKVRGERRDKVFYGILREEWEEQSRG